MALPSLPIGSTPLSYDDLLTEFGNTAYPPHNLSDYYGGSDPAWFDPDDPTGGSGGGGGGATTTGRLLVLYRPRWTSTSYRGDYQLNTIDIIGEAAYTFDLTNEGWEYKSWNSTNSNYATVASAYSGAETWTAIATSTSTQRFNRRSGSTPSGGTGIGTLGSYYIYAETSSTLQGFYGARSPEITIDSGSQSMFIQFGSYGSNCGPCYYYWMPTDNVNKTLIYAQPQINTTAIQNTTVAWTAP